MSDTLFGISVGDEGVFVATLTKKGQRWYNIGDNLHEYGDFWNEWIELDSIEDIPQEIRKHIPIEVITDE